ncbi:MAG: MG2 domain-containing protein, partial [Phycisphaerae bacterium]|nr:MG2 domain-containing protein [Phycisphaerae bacterium]
MAYLLPARRPWVVEEVDQDGAAVTRSYDAMLYTERGVYRPGETVHLTGILRDAGGQIPQPFPMTLTVSRPDGRKAAQLPVKVEAGGQGVFHADFTPPADSQEGEYRFAVSLPGSEEAFGEAATFVESFVPVRMEVKASTEEDRRLFAASQPVEVRASARYLFGQPAAGLPVTARLTLRPAPFKSAKFPDYVFTGAKVEKKIKPIEADAELDDEGKATLQIEPDIGVKGWWNGAVAVTVTEPGGRSVSTNLTVNVDTAGRYVGLLPPPSQIVQTGQPVEIPWVQVTGEDEPAAGDVAFVLSRVEWDWTVEQVRQERVWKSVERLVSVRKGTLTGDQVRGAKGKLAIQCPEPGSYRLVVTDVTSGNKTVLDLCAAWRGEEVQGFAVNRPERLDIVLDKARYAPGTQAHVVVRSPFAGTMLLTLETDQVLEQRVVELTGKSAELDLPVAATLRGGAFVTASVVRPVDPENEKWLPHRAVGMARLLIDPSSHKMAVKLTAPKKCEPGKRIRVQVQAPAALDDQRPGQVHLWAVDQGILLTTAFATPDPIGHFFAPRRLGVVSSDVFLDLLPDYKRPKTMLRIGGDESKSVRRLGPVPIKRRDSAIVWQKTIPLAADGAASVELALPDMTGELRVMAVAVDHDRYGSAEAAVTVTSALLVETSWPRFAAPGDSFAVPVKLFNTTDKPIEAAVVMEVVGPVKLSGKGVTAGPTTETTQPDPEPRAEARGRMATYTLPPTAIPAGKNLTVWVDATATDMGQASVRTVATTTAGELTAHDYALLTVRPAGPIHAVAKLVRVPASQPATIELDDAAFLPGTARSVVTISGQPTVQLRPAIEQLVDYPYGCVEQTASRLYALLRAPQVLSPDDVRVGQAGDMVRSGIVRLWSMQTERGGLSYWPGGSEPSLWASVYVGNFLAQAKRAGYEPDKKFIDELTGYLQRSLRRSDDDEKVDDNLRAQMLHVLAAFRQPQLGWMNRLQEHPDKLDIGGRAHLAAAWVAAGRKDLALAALPENTLHAPTAEADRRPTSSIAGAAALLDALVDLKPDHPWTALLADRLNKARTAAGAWGSTIDNAACLAALARYQAIQAEPSDFTGQVRVGALAWKVGGVKAVTFKVKEAGPLKLDCSGSGWVYACASTEGFAKDPAAQAYDRELCVRREWKDRDGKAVDPAKIKVGDLVRVEVTIQRIGEGGTINDVAIVDALPAGLEVENPTLMTSEQAADEGGKGTDHLEFRDDRVLLFVPVDGTARTYRYSLRATTAGKFALPPIQASSMYDPAFASIHGAGKIEITK